MSNNSIIWEGSTLAHDKQLLLAIVEDVVSGDQSHYEACVDKILKRIRTQAWQQKYTHRTFVFCIYYMRSFNIIELNLAMATQAIDALYFLQSRDTKENSLAAKVAYVFREVYGHDMPSETAQAIRILRNNVMHTGAIFGIPDALSTGDAKKLEQFCEKYKPTNQIMTERQILINLAGSFDYLVKELAVRVLGLEWDDLLRNGRPPSKLSYFCKPEDMKVFKNL